jgi:hypothetical protein
MGEVRKLKYEEEWRREIKRRVAEIESGAVKMIPWAEVKEHLYSLLRDPEKVSPQDAQSVRSPRRRKAVRSKPKHSS